VSINNTQFDALVKLTRLTPGSAMSEAARSVLIDGLTPSEAGRKHNTHRSNVSASVKSIRRIIPLVYIAVTGEEPK